MEINFLAVFLSALAAFFLGFIWYTVVFVKIWQKEIGLSDGQNKSNAQPPNLGIMLIGSFILELAMATALAYLIGENAELVDGLKTGAIIGFFGVAFAFGVSYLFEGKTFTHWLINGAYNTVVFAVMGMIIGVM